MEKKKLPPHRPSIFTDALANTICARLSEGESLRHICKDDAMPCLSTVMYWLFDEDKKSFLEHYERAREIQAEMLAEELLEIADDSTNDYMTRLTSEGDGVEVVNPENIQRSRLRVDTRKWVASKLRPKKYGDKLDLTTDNKALPSPIINVNRNENGTA